MMAIGAGSPYANLTQNSMQMVGSAQGLNPMYSGGSMGNPYMTGSAFGDFGVKVGTNLLFGSNSTK
jgi:hypothetical protein